MITYKLTLNKGIINQTSKVSVNATGVFATKCWVTIAHPNSSRGGFKHWGSGWEESRLSHYDIQAKGALPPIDAIWIPN